MQPETPVQRLRRYLLPQAGGVVAAVLAFSAAAATEPLIPRLLQQALDQGLDRQLGFPLWTVPLALIALFMLRGLLSFAGTYWLNRSSSLAVLSLRRDLTTALLRADSALFNRMPPGLAVAKVISDPQVMATQLTGAALTVLRDGTTAVALAGYLCWLNWQLTALALLVVPLLGLGVRKVHARIRSVSAGAYDAQLRLTAIVDDLARSWRVVRTFGAEGFEARRAEGAATEVQRGTVKAAAAAALMTPVSQTVASLGVALIVTVALYQGREGQATVGAFAAYTAALLLLVSRVRHLSDVAQPVVSAMVIARNCFELLEAPPEPDTGTHAPLRARGDIDVQALRVAYPGCETPALAGATLRIPAGRTVGLVGASGAGKSTLVQALLGFVQAEAGSLTLDGVEVSQWRKAALRQQFAVVSQDIVLFDASVAENVIYAAEPDMQRVEHCLRAAALWDLVSALPGGMHANIGVNGSKLSGGQRQRLAIARALYKDAPVWVFDEATSALDSEAEHAIQQALEQWHGQRTLLVIAHRLSTLRHADAIHVLEAGLVVESGSHAGLMARGGRYARLVALQQGKTEVTTD
jgi:subfamily B ATP-binding cassette protein MsbA